MHSVTLAQAVIRSDLFPTPTVVDLGNNKTLEEWEAWTEEQRAKHNNGNGHGASLSIEVQKLLPTATARDYKDGQAKHERNGKLQTDTISRAVNELPGTWGKFAPAIERWEQILGRPAPAPTNPDGKENKHRLSSRFTEWLMGLPEGWITDVGLTRAEELKACGNGVVPQQAKLALAILLDGVEW
jgi:DNA (cytosine-5)-methyltransferase 1